MPDTSLTDALKEAYALCPSDSVILNTLSFHHPVAGVHYVVADTKDWVLRLEDGTWKTFTGIGFKFKEPEVGDNGFQELQFEIDNVDRAASDYVVKARAHPIPIEVKYRPYLSSDTATPQRTTPIVLFLRDVRISKYVVSGRATFADILNRRFLNELYTTSRFPSLAYL